MSTTWFEKSVPDSPLDFILQRSVFRLDELEAYEKVESPPKSISRTLEPHLASGRVVAVRFVFQKCRGETNKYRMRGQDGGSAPHDSVREDLREPVAQATVSGQTFSVCFG